MARADEVIGKIGALQTMLRNFPMGVFSSDIYANIKIFDFLILVLKQLGVDTEELTQKIVELIFDLSDLTEEKIESLQSNPFIDKLDTSCKNIILNVIVSILSCSAVPLIPPKNKSNVDFNVPIPIPVDAIDPFNQLSICPTTESGKNFYCVESSLTPTTTYQSYDLNVFLWYVLNFGNIINDTEREKMIWDNRIEIKENDLEDDEKFNILHFNRSNFLWKKELNILFDGERYGERYGELSSTIYRFNQDYLNSVKLFSPKLILTNIVETLMNKPLEFSLDIHYSFNAQLIEAQVSQIIKNIIDEEEQAATDCYFSFSNEEYDNLMEEAELRKYKAVKTNGDAKPAATVNVEDILKQLDEINSAATSHERVATITKFLYDLAATPSKDASIEYQQSLDCSVNKQWLYDIISSIVMPIAKSLFSPKVLMIFVVNFSLLGLIDLNEFKSSSNKLMDLIYTKLIATIKSVIAFVKDLIIQYFCQIIADKLKELIETGVLLMVQEKLLYWTKLLTAAMACLPDVNMAFNRQNLLTAIDDVNYADIVPVQNKPESSGC